MPVFMPSSARTSWGLVLCKKRPLISRFAQVRFGRIGLGKLLQAAGETRYIETGLLATSRRACPAEQVL